MSLFPSRTYYVGIESSPSTTRVAVLFKTRKGWEVSCLKEFPTKEDVNLIDTFPKEAVIISALPSRKVLVRSCDIPLKKEKDILAALDFQVEPLLPYPPEKAILQAEPIEKQANKTVLTTFAVRKDHLQTHLDNLNEQKIEPERVTSIPSALAFASTLFSQSHSTFLIIHMGETEVTCAFIDQGKLLTSRAFERKASLDAEIKKTVLSFSSSHKTKSFETIMLLGTEESSFAKIIQKITGKRVVFPSSLNLSQEKLIHFGLSIGIALAGKGVNFRQKAFVYPYRWRRIKKPVIAFLVLSSLLSISLFGLGQFTLNNYKKEIRDDFYALDKTGDHLIGKSPAAYLRALSEIASNLEASPDTYPLLPQTPKVNEVFTWLSTIDSIKIESFRYDMIERPDPFNPKKHYKVRVELELSAKDVSFARKFYDKLLSPNPFVAIQEEVEWTASKGKYRAAFYLKDKTRYN